MDGVRVAILFLVGQRHVDHFAGLADPHAGWCGIGASKIGGPYADPVRYSSSQTEPDGATRSAMLASTLLRYL